MAAYIGLSPKKLCLLFFETHSGFVFTPSP